MLCSVNNCYWQLIRAGYIVYSVNNCYWQQLPLTSIPVITILILRPYSLILRQEKRILFCRKFFTPPIYKIIVCIGGNFYRFGIGKGCWAFYRFLRFFNEKRMLPLKFHLHYKCSVEKGCYLKFIYKRMLYLKFIYLIVHYCRIKH